MTGIEKMNELNKAVRLIKNHCMSTQCTDCMFNNSDGDCCFEVGYRPNVWEIAIHLSEREKQALSFIPDKYKWIARDENKELFAFVEEPTKNNNCWSNGFFSICEKLKSFEDLFRFIEWEDEVPINLDDLRKMCEE